MTKARDLANSVNAASIPGSRLQNDTITATQMAPASVGTSELQPAAATPDKTAGGPAFRAPQGVPLAAASAIWTKVTFGAEEFDTAICYASNRFTPTVAGYYLVNASVQYQGVTAAALFGCAIAKNGAPYSQGAALDTTLYARSVTSDLIYLNGTTDYVEAFVLHSQGAPQNVLGEYFSATWIRP
jgi:hypothetical protein